MDGAKFFKIHFGYLCGLTIKFKVLFYVKKQRYINKHKIISIPHVIVNNGLSECENITLSAN